MIIGMNLGSMRHSTTSELGEIRAERPSLARALGEHLGGSGIGLVAGAHDLDGGQAAFAITFDDHHVVAGHARHDVGALRFPIGGLNTRHLTRSRDNRLAGAGVAMPPRVFPRDVDVEPDMAVVLNAAHVQTATDQLGDELLDKGCLAGIMTPDDGDRGAGELDHAHILSCEKV